MSHGRLCWFFLTNNKGQSMERQKSATPTYKIPIRQIVANTNPRNPLSEELRRQGWTVFDPPPESSPTKLPLWQMATSNEEADRQQFATLMQTYDPEFVDWAHTFVSQGQLQPVEVRDNGKRKDGENTYTLIFGCRRCLAILYNWCLLGVPKEPLIEARLEKGNNVSLMHRAIIENIRRDPNKIEVAQAIKWAINQGQTIEEAATQQGCTPQTIKNKLALLDLPLDQQKQIAAGKLTATKAIKEAKPTDNSKPKMRPRKEIEAARSDFADGHPCARILDWILGRAEDFKV